MKFKFLLGIAVFFMMTCSTQRSDDNFFKKIKLDFPSTENYKIISLVNLFNSCFITGNEKPSVVLLNPKIKAIKQSVNSSIDYYLNIPKNSKLFFSIYSRKNIRFNILASSQDLDPKLIFSKEFNPKHEPQIYTVDLLPYQKKIIKLSFQVEGEGKGYWLNPIIIFKKEKTNEEYLKFRDELRRKAKKWNLIYIVLDAARPDHFSCYGYKYKTTPNIDKLARRSLIFKNAFTQAVYTLASTSSLFTGLYPASHYVVMDYQKLPDRFFTLAEAFKEKGYLTLAEVSNPYASSKFNMNQGFSFFKENWKTENILLSSETINKIKGEKKNFFLYLHYNKPHAPYDPPLKFRKKFISYLKNKDLGSIEYFKKVEEGKIKLTTEEIENLKKLYDANLNYVDHYLGKAIELLEKKNLLKNSIIIIASDHGEAFSEHQRFQHNSTVYEEMIRIPLIIKFPVEAGIKPRSITNLVEIIDLTATFFDLFELPKKMNYLLEGKSILPLLFPSQSNKEFIFSRTTIPISLYCIRDKRFKYIFDLNSKIETNHGELYDLEKDPKEKINISPDNTFLAFYFHQRLLQHLSSAQNIIKKEEERYIEIDEKTKERLRSLGYLD